MSKHRDTATLHVRRMAQDIAMALSHLEGDGPVDWDFVHERLSIIEASISVVRRRAFVAQEDEAAE